MGDIAQWIDGTFFAFDYACFSFFGNINCDILTVISKFFSSLSEQSFWHALFGFSFVLMLFKKTRKIGILIFMSCLLITLFNRFFIKHTIARLRPYNTLQWDTDFWNWYLAAGAFRENEYSFASGHTATAFIVSVTLSMYFYKEKKNIVIPIILIVYSCCVGCSRVYLMVHYASDVIGSMIIGIVLSFPAYYLGVAVYNILQRILDKIYSKYFKKKSITNVLGKITNNKAFYPTIVVAGLLICASIGYSTIALNSRGGYDKCNYEGEYSCQNRSSNNVYNSETNQYENYCGIHKPDKQ